MAKQTINIGTTANDRTGDPLRTAFTKINQNFTELYNDDAADFSGNYNDLTNKPNLSVYQLANTAFSGSYNNLTNKPNIPTDISDLTDSESLLVDIGDVIFSENTISAQDGVSLIIHTHDNDDKERVSINLIPNNGVGVITALSDIQDELFLTNQWASAQWVIINDLGYLVVTNSPAIVAFINSARFDYSSSTSFRINGGNPIVLDDYTINGNNITFNTPQRVPEESPIVVNEINFDLYFSSDVGIDYDQEEIKLSGIEVDINLFTTKTTAIDSKFIDIASNGTFEIKNRSTTDSIDIVTHSTENPETWSFGDDGTLTFPTGSKISKGYPGQAPDGSSWFITPAGQYGGLSSTDGEQYIQLRDDESIYIGTNWPNNIHEWVFDRNGSLTFPGDTYISDDILGTGYFGLTTPANTGFTVMTNDGSRQWVFGVDGKLTLPEGGTIAEGVVTNNPTIELVPPSPDVASQKLVVKGGGAYNVNTNGINLNYYQNTALVGDTLTFYVNSETYANQTLYWWIYPTGAGISDTGFGTVILADGPAGTFTFTVDSDDYEFTVRVSPTENVYDSETIGVESMLINAEAPTFSEYHLHLTTGNLTETSIFLGTDDHNARTTIDGKIQITTPNEFNNVWEFDTDGTLTLPSVVWNHETVTYTSIPVTYGETRLTFTVLPDNTIINMSVAVGAGGYGANNFVLTIPGTTFPGGTSPANDILFDVQTFESAGPVYSTDPASEVIYVSGTLPQRYDSISSTSGVGIGTGDGANTHHWTFGDDGNFTFPDGTNQTTAFNFTGYDNEIHVSQTDGNDTTGNGDLLKPVASITKALTLVTGGRLTVVVHPGTYTESPTTSVTNITIATTELTGANTLLNGTLTLGAAARVSGLKMNNLTLNTSGNVYISNCTVDTQLIKSGSGYTEIINSELQCSSGCQFTGAGQVFINGNKIFSPSVSNASASVTIRGANQIVTPSVTAGVLTIENSIVVSSSPSSNAITSSASSTITLANSFVLNSAGASVERIALSGFYSILNVVYDKANSTLAASSGTGGSTNSVDYFQYINADRVIANLAPASSKGVAGDRAGMIAATGSYLYVCTADYTSGVADIWSRTLLTASTW
jgi:hypothetical protein